MQANAEKRTWGSEGQTEATPRRGMFTERKINPTTGLVELWLCDWEKPGSGPARKIYIQKVGNENYAEQIKTDSDTEQAAICWSYGRTLGNIAVFSPDLLGTFPAKHGTNARLPCDFVAAGKFRNGAERWWCRTHQTHWGTKADQEAFSQSKAMRCANYQQLMSYVVAPFIVDLEGPEEVGIWASLPAAISTEEIKRRAPRIHVHVRPKAAEPKTVDADFQAVSIRYKKGDGLFANEDITRVNITPPAAFEFVTSLERHIEMDCVNCSNCGYPHLDLGEFAKKPHRKHFCGNCGRDSTWSKEEIISTPLKLLHDRYAKTLSYVTPSRVLNLDDYPSHSYTVWASTPAVVWTAARAQEYGIHVHVHDGTKRVVDDTFGQVVLNGKSLEREDLVEAMIRNSVV
jgi:hypothetical protein